MNSPLPMNRRYRLKLSYLLIPYLLWLVTGVVLSLQVFADTDDVNIENMPYYLGTDLASKVDFPQNRQDIIDRSFELTLDAQGRLPNLDDQGDWSEPALPDTQGTEIEFIPLVKPYRF